MQTKVTNSGSAPSIRATIVGSRGYAAAFALAAVLLMAALVGPGWLFVPANPLAKLPAMTLDFGNLHDLTHAGAVPSNAVQKAYFGWLEWTLVLSTIVLSAALVATKHQVSRIGVAAVSVAGLVFTVLGVKGPLTWSQLFDQIKNIRIGGYLVVTGYLVALAAAVALGRTLKRT